MKAGTVKWFSRAAAAGVLALTMAAPALQAQSLNDHQRGSDGQSQGQYDRGRNDGQSNRDRRDGSSYRDDQRISVQGRVTSFSRERGGYRVNLDRGRDSYWVPESYFHGHNLRVGVSVVLGGIFRGGAINVDAVSWPDDGAYGRGYERGFVAGVIQRIDYRDGTMLLRDRDGRMITADTTRWATRDLRRGDYVELSGDWSRGGVFRIAHVDNVRMRR